MSTLKREIRMKVKQILGTHQLDDLSLELDLVDMFYSYVERKPERRGTLLALADGEKTQASLLERVRNLLRLNVERPTKTNQDFIEFLKEKEREGMALEKFAQYWTGEHWAGKRGQVPTVNQVIENWYAAFDREATTLAVAQDGSFYV